MTLPSAITLNKNKTQWRVTINRQEKANALSREMLHALHAISVDAASATELRTLVIAGGGERVFCAGADLTELSGDPNDPRDKIWDELAEALVAIPALTIAMINGHCMGGGMILALGCDIRVCVPETDFAYPALRNGVLPGKVDSNRLNALIGPGRSSLLLLGDARIHADEALAWRLVERVVSKDLLQETVDSFCATARNSNRDHLAEMKKRCWGHFSE